MTINQSGYWVLIIKFNEPKRTPRNWIKLCPDNGRPGKYVFHDFHSLTFGLGSSASSIIYHRSGKPETLCKLWRKPHERQSIWLSYQFRKPFGWQWKDHRTYNVRDPLPDEGGYILRIVIWWYIMFQRFLLYNGSSDWIERQMSQYFLGNSILFPLWKIESRYHLLNVLFSVIVLARWRCRCYENGESFFCKQCILGDCNFNSQLLIFVHLDLSLPLSLLVMIPFVVVGCSAGRGCFLVVLFQSTTYAGILALSS